MTIYWLNDSIVDADDAKISVLDHGLTVGDGVFETLLVRDGVPFALTRHLARLERSLAGMGFAGPDPSSVRAAVAAVISRSGMEASRARLRVTVTSGSGPLGSERGDGPPTLIVTLTPTQRWPQSTAVATVPWVRNERSALVGLKSTSYAENAIALASAQRRGASEALLADTRGRLSEGTGSNIFVVVAGEVLTPSLDSGCLAGVTRELLIEWSRDFGGISETDLPYEVLFSADEVFLSSSTRDVHPVHKVDSRELPVGPVATDLAAMFLARAADDPDP
ncbi:unannotated protein [freshwater metagenome]|uniref:Unannotated protein n=2 Tax=freshwater metagenome TaxID=449393 RepID=A0A6J7J4E3_9ZZZZ|nr:4-amino-4-deoxychorismate lyase [Actinomycetota bacterium]